MFLKSVCKSSKRQVWLCDTSFPSFYFFFKSNKLIISNKLYRVAVCLSDVVKMLSLNKSGSILTYSRTDTMELLHT